jgi:hypothetical protein
MTYNIRELDNGRVVGVAIDSTGAEAHRTRAYRLYYEALEALWRWASRAGVLA